MKKYIIVRDSKKKLLILNGINRGITPSHVTKLADSINLMGCVRDIVVAKIDFLEEKGLYIIDGQNLYHALLRNNMDFPCVEIEIKNPQHLIEVLAKLNNSSKSWCLLDYIRSWSYIKPDYIKLNKYFNTYDIELSMLAAILSNSTIQSQGGSSVSKKVKSGNFAIVNEKENKQLLDNLTDVLKIAPRMSRVENNYLCSEYVLFYRNCSNYNHVKFLENLKKRKDELVYVTSEAGKLTELFQKIS